VESAGGWDRVLVDGLPQESLMDSVSTDAWIYIGLSSYTFVWIDVYTFGFSSDGGG